MKEAVFHPEARAEVDEAVEFYQGRVVGLGLRFLAAVEGATGRISASPEAGTLVGDTYRRWIVPGFPFSVFYRVWSDYIFIVAVAHQLRRPGYWRERTDRR